MSAPDPEELRRLYAERFRGGEEYRRGVWRVLISEFFQEHVCAADSVLDLGCGYGEFISQVRCARRWAMDMNPDAPQRAGPGVEVLAQDCARRWELPDASLDVVFTSNFFEHLADMPALERTLEQARRCLRPGGRLIALGPNIRFVGKAYWDFPDHKLALSEADLTGALERAGFEIVSCAPRFLPYTMSDGRRYPLFFVSLYLRLPFLWRVFGKQFLVVARKPAGK